MKGHIQFFDSPLVSLHNVKRSILNHSGENTKKIDVTICGTVFKNKQLGYNRTPKEILPTITFPRSVLEHRILFQPLATKKI